VVPESVSLPPFRARFRPASQSIKNHPFFVGYPSYLKVRFAAQAPDAQNQKSPSHTPPLERRCPPFQRHFILLNFSLFVTVVDSVRPLLFQDFRLIILDFGLCKLFADAPLCSIDFELSSVSSGRQQISPDSVSRLIRTNSDIQ
jgi:hypothetical protein